MIYKNCVSKRNTRTWERRCKDGFLQVILWYGIAWVVSLLVLHLPYRLSDGRLMFGPIRHLLFLDDRYGSRKYIATLILILWTIFLPAYAIKQCLTPDNWR